MPKKTTTKDRNKQLMLDCGSKTGRYDPEPPDQWLYQLNHGDAHSRVVAWVKSKTTAYGHHSPFAVDDNRKPLTLKHMAADLKLKYKSAMNLAIEVEREGLIRLEADPSRIYLCADVPKSRRTKGELKSFVQRTLAPYLIEQIERLSDIQKRKFYASFEAYTKWRNELIQDGIAELRSYAEQVEHTTLEAFGLQKKREVKRRIKKTHVKVELGELPDFVHSVQTEEDAVCTKSENGSVQTAVSLLPTDSEERFEKKVVGRSVSRPTDRPPLHQPEQAAPESSTPAPSGESPRLEALRVMLVRTLAAKLRDLPSTRLLHLVLGKLGTASLESLESRIMLRLGSITTYGMIPSLAADVAAAKDAPPTPTQPDAHDTQVDSLFRHRMMREIERSSQTTPQKKEKAS